MHGVSFCVEDIIFSDLVTMSSYDVYDRVSQFYDTLIPLVELGHSLTTTAIGIGKLIELEYQIPTPNSREGRRDGPWDPHVDDESPAV